ncbi:coiled-coil domain-containing protein 74B-like [Diadema antillarum]|uniref:coiled-coil domain-containing protein 74B-like n=1 Tax=Diadema antillarum TaxID=105358 RepID=UPI003A8A079C
METEMPVTSMSLPPLQNLPQWPRMQTLDKARYPKPFLKDHLQVLPATQSISHKDLLHGGESMDGMLSTAGDCDPHQRLQHLEKSIEFLKRQQREVLSSLHEEIEALKRENKELQFKVIMSGTESPKKELSGSSMKSDGSPNGSPAHKFDQMMTVKELKAGLQEARNLNAYLQQRLKETIEKRPQSQETGQQTSPLSSSASPLLPVNFNPLQVQRAGDPHPRPPTLEECSHIIRHLKDSHDRQSCELQRIKSDLKDVLYSHKWTPDAYLMAKAYIAEEQNISGDAKLPRISLKNPTRKLPDAAFSVTRDSFSLPPLTQTMGNRFSERQKRVDAVKRARHQSKDQSL